MVEIPTYFNCLGLTYFSHLCPKEKYSKLNQCHITGKTDKLKICPFCGNKCHKTVISRKRKVPDSDKFESICDKCNLDFNEHYLFRSFWKMVTQIKKIILERERDCREVTGTAERLTLEVDTKEKQFMGEQAIQKERADQMIRHRDELQSRIQDIRNKLDEKSKEDSIIEKEISRIERANDDAWLKITEM